MANENQTLTFKLVIDGKEAVATTQVTTAEVEQLGKAIILTGEELQKQDKAFEDAKRAARSSFQEAGDAGKTFVNNLGLGFDGVNVTVKDLLERLSDLRDRLQNAPIGSEQYQRVALEINSVNAQLQKLKESLSTTTESPMLKQFAKDLLLIDASAQEATSGIMDFIKYNELTEPEIQSVINSLREEQKVLAVGSAQWKNHGIAISNLSNAYQNTIIQQRQFAGGSSNARMAVSQFGYALGDASMIAVDFRMFLMGIGNNIPFIIQGLAGVSAEAKQANMSLGAFLKNNLDASMKMVLGANALMFALMVLPAVFNKINEASGDAAADGMKKFTDELKNMTSDQIIEKLNKVKDRIQEITNEKKDYANIVSSAGSYPVFQRTAVDPKDRGIEEKETALSDEEKKILEARIKRKAALELEIDDYDKLIDQVEKDALAQVKITVLRDQQAIKQNELNELLKTSAEREEDRKKAAEEQQKLSDEAKKKQDEYIQSISEQYELETELNRLTKQSNSDNIKDTRTLIDAQLKNNITLQQRVELLTLLDKLDNGWKEDRWERADAKPSDSKDYDEAQKRIKKLQSDDAINQKSTQYEKEKALDEKKFAEDMQLYQDNYKDGLVSFEQYMQAKDIIEAQYYRKSQEREKELFLYKINTIANLVSQLSNAYNQIYSVIESNVHDEVSTWKDKEDKKLETERDAALKHARTQAQRERINEQFDKRRDQLEEDANKKARERLAAWFYINQAVSATNAVIASVAAGINTLEQLSKYLPPPLPAIAMGVTIAAGVAQAAVISQQKLPGYKRGGAIVGEDGPEIIAPFQDYASGQSKLITMTMMTLRDELRSGRSSSSGSSIGLNDDSIAINKELRDLLRSLKSDGINARAYLDDREAKKVNARGSALNRRNKL